MNSKAIIFILIIALLSVALILMGVPKANHSEVHTYNSNTSSAKSNLTTVSSTGREAIFIDCRDPSRKPNLPEYVVKLNVPTHAILKIKDKIYALGGYRPLGVAVILSEDLRPLCQVELEYEIDKAEKYDEDRFVAMQQWWSYYPTIGSIIMFDSGLNVIWSIEGNFTDFKVSNGKIYALEYRGDFCYLDIFDGNGNLVKSFKAVDLKEVFNVEEIPEEVKDSAEISIEVRGDKIYVAYTTWHYVSGGVAGPFKTILSRFDEKGNLEIKKVIYETEKPEVVNSILSYKDEFILAISSSACRYLFIDEDGDILGEARWKPPFGEGCGAGAKVFDDRVYILGWDPNIFAGFVGFIDDSVYADVSSLYYTEAQVIFVKKDSVWQDNSVVRDILLDDDKLYVIGLVQMDKPSGAFIVRLDPYLSADISTLLEQADVVYLEDIPPCKP